MSALILASNSPRRREILTDLGYEFSVCPSLFEERAEGLSARDTVAAFARGKAAEVFSRDPNSVVLGADTVVAYGEEILGKPKSEEDAKRMLRLLSGKTHSVYTGVCVVSAKGVRETVVETLVTFNELAEETINGYVNSGLPMDKAGAYGIQDGFPLVKEIKGSYTNVVGLPAEETQALLSAVEGIHVETCD